MNIRKIRVDLPRVLSLKARGVTNQQIAERYGCTPKALSVMLNRHYRREKMREGDVLIVQRVPHHEEPPPGFTVQVTAPSHYDRHSRLAAKLVRRGAR